jgi:hypothetical protein
MELADFIRELLRRKVWVVLAALIGAIAGISVVYQVDYRHLTLRAKHFEAGAASTQLLVDSAEQPLGDYRAELEPLTARAQIYAQLMTSRPVLKHIAHDAGLPARLITALGPSAATGPSKPAASEPVQRSNQLAYEGRGYRLAFSATPQQPTVSIFAQAPTAKQAARLANAARRRPSRRSRASSSGRWAPRSAASSSPTARARRSGSSSASSSSSWPASSSSCSRA